MHEGTPTVGARRPSRAAGNSLLQKAVVAVIFIGVFGCAVSYAQNFRLLIYLTATDPGALPAIPNPAPPNYPDLATPPEYGAQQNPTLRASSRLWLWTNALDDPLEPWVDIGLSIDSDGPLRLSNLYVFNPNYFDEAGRSARRWGDVYIRPLSPDGTEYPQIVLDAPEGRYGIPFPQPPDGYSDGKAGNVLLGYFDVTYSGMGPGTVWLEVAQPGIYHSHSPTHQDFIYLGFGDEPVGPNDVGRRTALPEATFVPEPATLLLIVAGIAPILRRRRAWSHGPGRAPTTANLPRSRFGL